MLSFIRYWLPAVVFVAGLIIMSLGSTADLEGGAGIVSAGAAVFFVNWLYRIGVTGDRERDAEEEAREFLDLHGYWPDEAPPA